MFRSWKNAVAIVSVATLMSAALTQVYAQSATKTPAASPAQPAATAAATAQGSAQKAAPGLAGGANVSSVAMDGYCPVCIKEMKQWVMGKPEFSTLYQGRTYYFPGEKQKSMFVANPAKYAPAAGGDCTVCQVEMGKKVAGDIRYGLFYNDQLYFFAGNDQKAMFAANPAKYAMKATAAAAEGSATRGPVAGASAAAASAAAAAGSATKPSTGVAASQGAVAFEGYCPVCLKEMKQWIPGKAEFAATVAGKKYLFPGEKQRQMFLADPAKYAPVLDGDCTVCRVEMNKSVPGSVRYAMYHKGQLYLFPGEEQKAMFAKNPEKYEVPAAVQAEVR